MANPTYTLQQKINQLLQYKTQKQAAVILGISDRTIRRWKSGRVTQPAKKSGRAVKRLSKQSSYYRSESVKHGAPKSLAIAPPIIKVPVKDAPMSTHADVRKLDNDSIVNYIKAVTDQGDWVRFLIAVPKSPNYPKGIMTTHWYNFKNAPQGIVERELNKLSSIKKIIATNPK